MACGATLTLKRSLEFDPLHTRYAKRQRCMASAVMPHTSPVRQNVPDPSPFAKVVPKLSNDQIASRITHEIKRLQHRRRALPFHAAASSSSPSASGSSSPQQSSSQQSFDEASATSRTLSSLGFSSTISHETPLLTLRQVGLVCERLLKEREDQLREEYNKVLTDKLTEQYEAFLRFNHDQLNRRFGEAAASYVS